MSERHLQRGLPCSDKAVKEKTGWDWAEWCAALDEEDAAKLTHTELAQVVDSKHNGGDWWSQTVAVGYERLRGKRAVRQQSDGHFAASVSKTLPMGANDAHDFFVDAAKRRHWLNETIIIRKATAPKSVRITWPDNTNVEVWITEKGVTKCTVAVQHTKLVDEASVGVQKEFWKMALERLAQTI